LKHISQRFDAYLWTCTAQVILQTLTLYLHEHNMRFLHDLSTYKNNFNSHNHKTPCWSRCFHIFSSSLQ